MSNISSVELINPLGFPVNLKNELALRLKDLNNVTIGFIDNIKPNAGLFLDFVENLLQKDYPNVKFVKIRKDFTSSRLIADQLIGKVSGVVNAWGDWGGCTSWCIHDSAYLEKNGIPTSTVVSTAFVKPGRLAAKNLQLENLPLLIVPHPLNDLKPNEVNDLAVASYPTILNQLMNRSSQDIETIINFMHPAAIKKSNETVSTKD